ncbi:MAG: choice-of-anchor A family protein, partial [Proteobacteria bacterium]|nr:choice-of-anchor A family protein [Pseudomonadota bacterium]
AHMDGATSITYGGASAVSQNGGLIPTHDANVLDGLPMSLADYATSLKDLSSTFSGLSATQTDPTSLNSNHDLVIDATGGGTGLAVIDIDPSLLSGNQVSIDTEGYSTVVINVAGVYNSATNTYSNSFAFNPGTFSTSAQTTVIWNFYQADTLSITGQFNGSILAPYATLTNNTQINGSVAVAGFQQGGEIHMANYDGTYDFPPPDNPPPGVPEPAAWALMILGFGGAGAALRRRRAATA